MIKSAVDGLLISTFPRTEGHATQSRVLLVIVSKGQQCQQSLNRINSSEQIRCQSEIS